MDKKEYFDTSKIKCSYQVAVAEETAKALISFCEREPEFEQAIDQSGKSFQECLDAVCKGIKNHIPDLEVYNRAAKFYFPVAKVFFNMYIDLSGDNGYEAPPITMNESKKAAARTKETPGLNISLDDLLDF